MYYLIIILIILNLFKSFLARGASWQSEGRADDSVEEHRAILEAIEKRDGAKAREEMSRHVCNALSNVMDHHLQDYRAKQDN